MVFVLAGGWIFYNTNILNDYQDRPVAAGRQRPTTSARYGAFKSAPGPAMTDLQLTLDLYPRRAAAGIRRTRDPAQHHAPRR